MDTRAHISTIELTPVQSTNVSAIGWRDQVLAVKFHSGRTYFVDGVSAELWEQFKEAPSKGQFFAKHINPRIGDGKPFTIVQMTEGHHASTQ